MIAVRRYAEFRTDFPDDHVWDESGQDVVQTGGKAVARAIADVLVGFGCIIHELTDNVGHCWECGFSYENLGLWLRVYDFDSCFFILEEPHRAKSNFPLYLHVLLKLNEALRRDGRFHDLVWRTCVDKQIGQEAFQVPVEGDIPPVEVIKRKRSFLQKLLAPLMTRPEVHNDR